MRTCIRCLHLLPAEPEYFADEGGFQCIACNERERLTTELEAARKEGVEEKLTRKIQEIGERYKWNLEAFFEDVQRSREALDAAKGKGEKP